MIAFAAVMVAVVATAVACVVELRRRDDVAFAEANERRQQGAYNELAVELFDLQHSVVEIEEPAAWLERKIRHRIIVHTIDERSYEGLLEVTAEDGVVLVGTRMLTEGGMQVAGEVFIPRSQVLFIQRPRGEE